MDHRFDAEVLGYSLSLYSSDGCFSPRQIDRGTLAMLSRAGIETGQKILDLGCGYGVVGILCAKIAGESNVMLCDIDPEALRLARYNAEQNGVPDVKIIQSDGFDSIDEAGFDLILSNPPYHADFNVPKRFIEKGFNRLRIGGRMLMVTRREEWYKKKMTAVFGGVRVVPSEGYFVFEAVKKSTQYANRKY